VPWIRRSRRRNMAIPDGAGGVVKKLAFMTMRYPPKTHAMMMGPGARHS
jgi:hypothetical protein